MKPFCVYMLVCGDGSYYCGHTDDLTVRMLQHDEGRIGYTATRKPVRLVWQGEFETRDEALVFERRIKGWSRAKKEALVAGDWSRVSALARGSTPVRPELVEGSGSREASTSSARTGVPGPEASTGSARTVSAAVGEAATSIGTKSNAVRPELVEGHAEGILARNRRALAKAITLLESTRPDHRAQADALLDTLMPRTGTATRIGISGVPGVGKSTFVEALGLKLIDAGHRVAVLAIDPSSSLSGGSILGDKTRMERLSVDERAFIRPSPASGTLGGVAEKTRESMLLCEAAGYDVVIVETVGVGQSETTVAGMTDLFVLLQLPNAGDDLQAIKRGVMELADVVLINKADIDAAAATRAQAQITSALRVFGFHGKGSPGAEHSGAHVMQVSASTGTGIDAFWSWVEAEITRRRDGGSFDARRRDQAQAWMWDIVRARLLADFHAHTGVRAALPTLIDDVAHARTAPSVAARRLLDAFEHT